MTFKSSNQIYIIQPFVGLKSYPNNHQEKFLLSRETSLMIEFFKKVYISLKKVHETFFFEFIL